jgi:hypothetical protein
MRLGVVRVKTSDSALLWGGGEMKEPPFLGAVECGWQGGRVAEWQGGRVVGW